MKLASSCVILVMLLASAAWPQKAAAPTSTTGKNPVTDVVRAMLSGRQKNTVAAVEEMPANKFSYKPTPEQMTFAHLVLHMTAANNSLCAAAAGVAPPPAKPLAETAPKERLVDALKTSFEFCSAALARADDAKLGEMADIFGESRPRAFALIVLANGWADHYATAAMYLRLNGLLPPTAQKK
jgi:DinB superfamily